MRRAILLALGLALVAGTAGAQEFIRYHPPTVITDGANAWAFRNGTSAQSLNIYNTFTSDTNYERASLYWSGNTFYITTQAGSGGGASRNYRLWPAGGVVDPGQTDAIDLGEGSLLWQDLYLARTVQGSKSKSLTDAAAAVAYATIAVPTNGQIAGELIWTATSSASAVRFVANGSVRFWGTDEGGTPVCGINKIGTDGEGHSSGAATLVCTWTNVVATTNCAISVTCTNSTAGTDPITVNGRLNMPTTATITFN